jgi:hypothetical protein
MSPSRFHCATVLLVFCRISKLLITIQFLLSNRYVNVVVWSSGMIPVLGTGGHGFNSRNDPFFAHREKEGQGRRQSSPDGNGQV